MTTVLESSPINIDKDPTFINPFTHIEPIEDSYIMYELYLKNKSNRDILTKIGNNDIDSGDYESFGITKSEILQKVACKLKFRNKLTIVRRNILNNTYGIILNQVNCSGEIGGPISMAISSQYPIVRETYNQLKVKQPGEIQLVNVRLNDYPLIICNIFGVLKSSLIPNDQPETSLLRISKNFLKRALIKLRVKIVKQKLEKLSVYIPYDMGKYHGWNWADYEPVIQKYLPEAIICKE